jgi:Family of unknown function (DUF5946)
MEFLILDAGVDENLGLLIMSKLHHGGVLATNAITAFNRFTYTLRILFSDAHMLAIESNAPFETCPDCRLQLAPVASPRHPYLGASASCWSLYNELLAREYSSPALMKSVHRLTVDAYAAQHPGKAERRSIQSVWVHLAGLYLILERGLANDFATRTIGTLTATSSTLIWLAPPEHLGSVTVIDIVEVRSRAEHEGAVRRWARSVWDAWEPHHRTIQASVSQILSAGRDS